jgi:murein DD-endopeptidase MepM/ murein hydrolase activator NlpD
MSGSHIPAEQRVSQIIQRIDTLAGSVEQNNYQGQADINSANAQNFKTLATMMQANMLGQALSGDKDSSDGPFGSMMGSMMGMNFPGGAMNQLNPMMQMMNMSNPMWNLMQQQNPGGQINPINQMQYPLPKSFNDSDMVMPVQGKISSEYGHRHHPIKGHAHFHSGVDIAAPQGTPIRMPWAGKVVFVGNVQGFGENTVIVAHENQVQENGKIIYSVFGHNSDVFVRPGDLMEQGEIVAAVGSEGNSTGPHLHWETRIASPGLQGTQVFNQNLAMTVNPMNYA